MCSYSRNAELVDTVAVLSVTGTESNCARNRIGGESVRAFWVMMQARLPPADEPPVAILEVLTESREGPSASSQSSASQQSCTAAGQGFSGAKLHGHESVHVRAGATKKGIVCRIDVPIVHRDDYTVTPRAEIRAHRIFRVDVSQYPSSTVEVQHHRPSTPRLLTLGREHANLDIRSLGNPPLDGDILRLTHLQQRTTTRDQNTASSRCSDGLKMHLLKVDDMLVVESDVFRIQKVLDGLMQGIWWLRVGGGHCQ